MNPDTEKLLDLLENLPARELRIILARAQELDALYRTWEDPRNYQTQVEHKGTYIQERVLCGKPNCKSCSELGGHGPYWYHYSSENGKTKKRYIGKNKPADNL